MKHFKLIEHDGSYSLEFLPLQDVSVEAFKKDIPTELRAFIVKVEELMNKHPETTARVFFGKSRKELSAAAALYEELDRRATEEEMS